MGERVRLRITGRVQGVGFRWFAQSAAARAGCTGWVRNLPDGSVEVVAEGAPDALADLQAACQCGPAGGRVEHVARHAEPATGEFAEFEIA